MHRWARRQRRRARCRQTPVVGAVGAAADLSARDLFNGPWGAAHAPDPDAVYTYVRPKKGGINPGMIVRDPQGREWHVKQPPHTVKATEGPVEVMLSRVLSALGYHQPPVYYLPSFTMRDGSGTHRERADASVSTSEHEESRRLVVAAEPLRRHAAVQGLLVILLMFNSSDLKNSNNTLYDVRGPDGRASPGTSCATSARRSARPDGSGPCATIRISSSASVHHRRPPRVRAVRLSRLASGTGSRPHHARRCRLGEPLLSGLSDRQWRDAFRAGGYTPDVADRFIRNCAPRSRGPAASPTTSRVLAIKAVTNMRRIALALLLWSSSSAVRHRPRRTSCRRGPTR